MASFLKEIPSMTAIFSAYTTISAIAMVVRSIINELIPRRLRDYVASKVSAYLAFDFSSHFTFIIDERWEAITNQTYRAAEVYLPTIIGPSTNCLLIGSNDTHNMNSAPKLSIPVGAKVIDDFEGKRFEWTLGCRESKKLYNDIKYFQLTCNKTDRENVLERYIPHVSRTAQSILNKREHLYIYTYNQEYGHWESTVFKHPSTFETLAMDPARKYCLKEDLNLFVKRKAFFDNVGRAWKRGYLLYGPPGTGKSSLVAAVANHLKYNIYDLQFQSVKSDADLRHILTSTTNRSIILIEDIDCSAKVSSDRGRNSEQEEEYGRADKTYTDPGATLCGLLNFIDGLWSSCGEERIIIFTTNHKDKLDPALLRPGRMDVHLSMGYCTFDGFKILAKTYLGIKDEHAYFKIIEKRFKEVEVTPAEVAQQLMKDSTIHLSLEGLIRFLDKKQEEQGRGPVKGKEPFIVQDEEKKNEQGKRVKAAEPEIVEEIDN